MPGDENNPHLQPAGTSAEMGVNNPHPAPGVQQGGGGVPDPTLQAVVNLQTAYNSNGGPAIERGNVRDGAESGRRSQTGGSRRSFGQNPPDPPAPPAPVQSNPTAMDMSSKEGKFSVLDNLEPVGLEEENRYVPNPNKVLFSKMKWSFDGQDSFEDYVVRIGG